MAIHPARPARPARRTNVPKRRAPSARRKNSAVPKRSASGQFVRSARKSPAPKRSAARRKNPGGMRGFTAADWRRIHETSAAQVAGDHAVIRTAHGLTDVEKVARPGTSVGVIAAVRYRAKTGNNRERVLYRHLGDWAPTTRGNPAKRRKATPKRGKAVKNPRRWEGLTANDWTKIRAAAAAMAPGEDRDIAISKGRVRVERTLATGQGLVKRAGHPTLWENWGDWSPATATRRKAATKHRPAAKNPRRAPARRGGGRDRH